MREMKDSGISWVGDIPQNWEMKRLKYLFKFCKGLPITKDNLIDQGLPVISYGQIHAKTNNGVDVRPHLLRFVDFSYQTFYPLSQVMRGDFVFADTSEDYDGCGNCVYKRNDSLLFAGYHTIIAHSIIESDNRFFAYLFLTDIWRRQIREKVSGVKVFSITQKTLSNSYIILPPLAEQQRIAEFLDRECGKIDGLKADIQAQIDTLEQYKRSIITETVTHGLNPSAPMKDSGIPWVGEIPAKWAVLPIYCVYGERKRKNVFGTEQNLLSLSYGKVIRKDINTNGGLLPSNYNGYNIIEKNDIIIRPTDLQNDRTSLRTGLVKEHGIITSAYIALKPKNRVSSKFYHYLLHSYDVKKVFYNMGNGVRQGLNYGEFAKLMVYYPPLDEQQEIADYLDNKCAEIEQIIVDKKSQIETLDGYKKSLIYEYVTGKKEVV